MLTSYMHVLIGLGVFLFCSISLCLVTRGFVFWILIVLLSIIVFVWIL